MMTGLSGTRWKSLARSMSTRANEGSLLALPIGGVPVRDHLMLMLLLLLLGLSVVLTVPGVSLGADENGTMTPQEIFDVGFWGLMQTWMYGLFFGLFIKLTNRS